MGLQTMLPESVRERASGVPLGTFGIAIVVGIFGIFLYGLQFSSVEEALSVISIAGFVGGAALSIGAAIGFLFGIPRTLQNEDSERGTTVYRANTNLEQISDWLTKILVGVGLTQVSRLPSRMEGLTDFLAPGLGGLESSGTFALGIVIYFLVCGFFLGYLWTRLFLAGALASADQRIKDLSAQVERAVAVSQEAQQASQEVRESVESAATNDVVALSLVDAVLNPSRGAPVPALEELRTAIAKASPTVRVQILLKAQDVRSQNWRNDRPTMERTIPVLRALAEGPDAASEHAIHGQLGFALKDQTTPDWQSAADELTKAITLRGDWQQNGWLFYEFNRAACRIMLDPSFQQETRSDDTTREVILRDLRGVATDDYLMELIQAGEANIKRWLDLNRISIAQLRRQAAGARAERAETP